MNTNSKDIYKAPDAEVVEIKVESVICESCTGCDTEGGTVTDY